MTGFEASRQTAFGRVGLWWGDLPQRKSKVLCVYSNGGQHMAAAAYFRDEDSFEQFTAAMRQLLGREEEAVSVADETARQDRDREDRRRD